MSRPSLLSSPQMSTLCFCLVFAPEAASVCISAPPTVLWLEHSQGPDIAWPELWALREGSHHCCKPGNPEDRELEAWI